MDQLTVQFLVCVFHYNELGPPAEVLYSTVFLCTGMRWFRWSLRMRMTWTCCSRWCLTMSR